MQELIGREDDLSQVGGALKRYAMSLRPSVVGAYQVCCSDEAEWEGVEAFQRVFSGSLLPALKTGRRAAFHTINLGARYEQGAVHVAEEHYALAQPPGSFKFMLVAVHSHVAVRRRAGKPEYGLLDRYGRESSCCGALAAMLSGARLPAIRELAETFAAAPCDRLSALGDPAVVQPEHRALLAALVNARLQAGRAAADIESRRPHAPTLFLVLPCVTLNRPELDTELVVGRYLVDWREASPTTDYRGLGDDPARYRMRHDLGRLVVEDDRWPER